MEVPKFDNKDDREGTRWINKGEKYFGMHHICDKDDKSTLRQCTWRDQLMIGSCGGTLNVGEG